MLSLLGRVNEQVIHVDDEPPFGDKVAEEMVHKHLECGRGVAEPKEHDSGFEKTKGGDERRLPAIFGADQHVVVAPAYVHFGKNTRASETADEVRDEWEGIHVFDGVRIDISVVLAGTYQSILLWNEEEWGHLGGLGRLDLACGKMFVYEASASLVLLRVQRVYFGHLRHKVCI
jgi:hypothetical protein